jgi:microcystin-dependent protein
MPTPFLGELKLVPYNFAPAGWAFCNGQIMPIAQNTALFSLLGTTYGGNGQTTFALPDMRGRATIGSGEGTGLSEYFQGQEEGVEDVTVSTSEMPAHGHQVGVSTTLADKAIPTANHLATSPFGLGNVYGAASETPMPPSIVPTGSNQPHSNLQPYLCLSYIIALQGAFPPRQ